ncbi:NAD(P)H-hydrate dehydratase [Candidatus Peregrinibacteria bacterium CG10_big_fil_rev_8_21_14_0_10_54_7]|nr:MAG: NAD(P)H-hydrate dehydratase [Candidatus Peregrinibacteria bacterium CG10_big_fil_rev_8_21_14_0_10_54_7]
MQRSPDSHKGENGKVAVVGGSRHMHGAPLLAALAAEASGVDLVFVCLPACHEGVAKETSLNMQVHPFRGDDLKAADREPILELLATMDSAVIGPGIARTSSSIAAVEDIIAEATCALVLDAAALQKDTLEKVRGKNVVLTPHLGELERMGLTQEKLPGIAAEKGVTFLLKGTTDHIADARGTEKISGGNAGLTVGGTGDALAGLIAGLIAQGEPPLQACARASSTIKKAGELLFLDVGYAYTARDVIEKIPHLLAHD